MHPRTLALVLVAILGGAIALRVVLVRYGWLAVTEEAVLKRAVALTVHYFHLNQAKTVQLSEAQTKEALAALRVYDQDRYFRSRGGGGQTVIVFRFNDGSQRTHTLYFNQLDGLEVDPEFARKLSDILTLNEGHHVDLFSGAVLDGNPANWKK